MPDENEAPPSPDESAETDPTEPAATEPTDTDPPATEPDETEPDETEPAANPITPATMLGLAAAVIVVTVMVLVLVVALRPDTEPPAPTAEPPATFVPAAVTPEPATTAPPTVVAPAATTTTTPPTLAAGPYEVAQAPGPGPISVFAAIDAPAPIHELPALVKVGIEQQATVPLVMLIRSRPAPGWLEVHLPLRPNGSIGFVRAGDVLVQSHPFRIEVRLSAFNLKAYDGDRLILDAPIAEAADNTPTPGGVYYTNMLLKPPDPNTAYGTYAYGLSGYSDTISEFNGGPGQLGIHGTNEPELMGQKVSSGCIRLRNQDIEQLVRVLPLGVPVLVTA